MLKSQKCGYHTGQHRFKQYFPCINFPSQERDRLLPSTRSTPSLLQQIVQLHSSGNSWLGKGIKGEGPFLLGWMALSSETLGFGQANNTNFLSWWCFPMLFESVPWDSSNILTWCLLTFLAALLSRTHLFPADPCHLVHRDPTACLAPIISRSAGQSKSNSPVLALSSKWQASQPFYFWAPQLSETSGHFRQRSDPIAFVSQMQETARYTPRDSSETWPP